MEFKARKSTNYSCPLIAIAQIIGSVVGIFKLIGPLLNILPVVRNVNWLVSMDTPYARQLFPDLDPELFSDIPLLLYTIMLIALLIFIVIPGIAMGIILIVGSHVGRPGYLKGWLVYAFFGLILLAYYTLQVTTWKNGSALGVLVVAMICVHLRQKELTRQLTLALPPVHIYPNPAVLGMECHDDVNSDSGEYAKCGDGYEST